MSDLRGETVRGKGMIRRPYAQPPVASTVRELTLADTDRAKEIACTQPAGSVRDICYGACVDAFEERMRRGGQGAVAEATGFFMRDDPVHGALRAIASRLDEHGVSYAVAGGMALVVHGYDRTTVDVDVLVTLEGLNVVLTKLVGFGYRPAFEGARKQLRDTERGVRIEFLVAGEFPGDGRPKPVAFPDPTNHSVEFGGIRYVSLATLIEMKLASGQTNPGRLKDLADVQELTRARDLPLEFRDQLHPYVRDKYAEIWQGAREDRA